MATIEEQEQEQAQRIAAAVEAEKDLLDQLQQRGLVDVWSNVRGGLHCERFLESRTGKAFADRLIRTIIEAQTEWLLADDPAAAPSLQAHRRAQAAHMALFTLDEIIADGKQAQIDLEQIAREFGE